MFIVGKKIKKETNIDNFIIGSSLYYIF